MSQIEKYSGGSSLQPVAASPWSSQGRAMARIVSGAELQVAHLAAAAHVENAKVDALDMVTQRAMQGTAMLAQLEGQLTEAVPAAAFRLAQIGQAHTLAMIGEIHRFSRVVQ